MSSYTLRPNATVSNTGWTVTGAASAHAAENDNSDSSYLAGSGGLTDLAVLSLDTFTLPAAETVKQIRIRARVAVVSGSRELALKVSGGGGSTIRVQNIASTSITTVDFGWGSSFNDSGGNPVALTQSVIDALQIEIDVWNIGSSVLRVYEVYVDIETTTKPTVTVTAPSGTINTGTPTITWDYNDTEGDPQHVAYIKIFSQAQYSAGGFDPETSTATYSNDQWGTAESIGPVSSLTNGNYRAYVKVLNYGLALGQYSDWAYASFTVNTSPATAPTLAVTLDDTNARAQLVVTGTGPALASGTRRFEVERTDDGGTTWERLTRLLPTSAESQNFTSPTQQLTFYDYEAPRGVAVQYRARVRSDLSGGAVDFSAWTTSSAFTLTTSGWRLKSLTDSSKNITLTVRWESFSEDEPIDVGEFDPIDSDETIVVTGRTRGRRLAMTLRFNSDLAWQAFRTLRLTKETLLLQDTNGRQWYVRLGGRARPKEWKYDGALVRELDVEATEVAV